MAKDDPQTSADAREKGATPKGHGAKSDAVREAAIRALLTEKSIQRAAERCRVNKRTLRRWLTEDESFLAEYDNARQALHRAGMARVQALTGKGVETREELLDAKKFPAVRLGVARTVVELGIHQHDSDARHHRTRPRVHSSSPGTIGYPSSRSSSSPRLGPPRLAARNDTLNES